MSFQSGAELASFSLHAIAWAVITSHSGEEFAFSLVVAYQKR
ncbi:MAG: hypothetical protein V7L13_13075 [Nostoc sp.]